MAAQVRRAGPGVCVQWPPPTLEGYADAAATAEDDARASSPLSPDLNSPDVRPMEGAAVSSTAADTVAAGPAKCRCGQHLAVRTHGWAAADRQGGGGGRSRAVQCTLCTRTRMCSLWSDSQPDLHLATYRDFWMVQH